MLWNGIELIASTYFRILLSTAHEFLSQSTGPKPLFTPEHTHLPKAYKLVWQKKKITLWLLFQCASRNVRLTGRERTCGPSHSTAFLPRFGLTVDFIFWFMFASKVWIITTPPSPLSSFRHSARSSLVERLVVHLLQMQNSVLLKYKPETLAGNCKSFATSVLCQIWK